MFSERFALALAGAWGIFAIAPAAARDEAPAPPSAAELVALPAIEEPILSPDGTRIAARVHAGTDTRIRIADATAPARERDLALPAGHELVWLRWAGNARLLASLGGLERVHGEQARATRLYVYDLAAGQWHAAGPADQDSDGDHVMHVDRSGRFALLSTQARKDRYPAVYRVDLTSGIADRVVTPQRDVWDWYADSAGAVRAGVASKGDRRWMVYRATDDQAFARPAARGPGDLDRNGVDQLIPVAGSDQGYAIAGGAHGRYALFRYDFAHDRIGALVYENPSVDIDGFATSPEGAALGVTYNAAREETRWFDARLAEAQARIDRALPGKVNNIVSMSADRSRLLVWSGAAEDPGGFWLFDTGTGGLTLFARTHPELAGKRLSPMHAVSYASRDGLAIPAYLTLPAGRAAKDLPLIVMPHGGPFVRDTYGYDAWVQYLAGKGYAVLQPNYRGSTGYGRDFVAAGDGQWGRGMQDDADDGVKWLAAQGLVDARRVCIMGASYGGYAAMHAAERNPGLYRCAISFAGISDVAAQLAYDRKTFESDGAFRAWRDRIRGKGATLDQLSPLKAVARMTVPILIAHGTADTTVPVSQSIALHRALEKLGRPHDYVIYQDEGHGLDDPAHNADFLGRVGAFLDRYNPS